MLAWFRPRNGVAWLLFGVGGLQLIQVVAAAYGSLGAYASPDWPLAGWVVLAASTLWVPGLLPLAFLLPALYPTGHLPGAAWRWPVGAGLLGTAVLTSLALVSPDAYDDTSLGPSPLVGLAPPGWLSTGIATAGAGLFLVGTVIVWVLSVIRLVRVGSPERQQLAWLLVVIVPMFVTVVVVHISPFASGVVFLLLPVSVAIGVFRYNLLGIEVVIRRGLVYGAMTAMILATYMVLATVATHGGGLGLVPAVAAAALVAVALAPLREWLQRVVDRLLYGDRHDPVRALSRLGRQVSSADEPDMLGAALASVATAVHAPGATVLAPNGNLIGATGSPGPGPTVALMVSSRTVGTLQIALRGPADRYGTADIRLLELLAPQLAIVVYALDLAETLESERDRVVEATGAERERLRHDLHDGLGPSLSGIRLGLVAVTDAMGADDPATASRLIGRLGREVADAVIEVRRIIDGLRPATLEAAGLVGALRRQLAAAGVPVELTVSELDVLPAPVETATLRIAAEALANIGKHAHATSASVRLEGSHGTLHLCVSDDGRGFDPADNGVGVADAATTDGLGLISMRRRAEALGGSLRILSNGHGTTIDVTMPLVAT